MNILFMGSGSFGLPTLQRLSDSHRIVLVISQPDRPAGRKRIPTPTPIAEWAAAHNLPLIKTDQCNSPEVLDAVRAANPDVNVVVAFGQYIRPQLADLPPLGSINLHGSLLPKYRGAGPVNWAILRGETQTGNTIIRLAPRMDAGSMLAHVATPIDPLETAGELHDRLASLGPALVASVLDQLQAGSAIEVQQDEPLATTAPKLSRDDARIDFNAPADAIRCTIHGLTPWPGVSVSVIDPDHNDLGPVKLCRVQPLPDHPASAPPGTITQPAILATSPGSIRLLEVQPHGKRIMPWPDYARSRNVGPGTKLVSTI